MNQLGATWTTSLKGGQRLSRKVLSVYRGIHHSGIATSNIKDAKHIPATQIWYLRKPYQLVFHQIKLASL